MLLFCLHVPLCASEIRVVVTYEYDLPRITIHGTRRCTENSFSSNSQLHYSIGNLSVRHIATARKSLELEKAAVIALNPLNKNNIDCIRFRIHWDYVWINPGRVLDQI